MRELFARLEGKYFRKIMKPTSFQVQD